MKITKLKMGENTLDSKTKVIKFEGDNDCLFWRVDGEICNPDAKIVVPETHWVIFIKDGERQNLNTAQSVPVFNAKRGFLGIKKTDSATVSVIFISRTAKVKNNWGLGRNPIELISNVINEPVSLCGSGSYEMKVKEPVKFYTEVVSSSTSYTLESFKERVNDLISMYVKDICSNMIDDKNIDFYDISKYIFDISTKIEERLAPKILNDYGIEISNFIVNVLDLAEEDKKKMKNYYAKRNLKKEFDETYEFNKKVRNDEQQFKKQADRDNVEIYANVKKIDADEIKQNNETMKEFAKSLGKTVNDDSSTNVKYCPDCGTKNERIALFCSKCGYEFLNNKKHCPNCKKEVEKDARFCSNCGCKL